VIREEEEEEEWRRIIIQIRVKWRLALRDKLITRRPANAYSVAFFAKVYVPTAG
jgi:hypothetical protein